MMPDWVWGRMPVAVTVRLYLPGGKLRRMYRPSESVMAVYLKPLSSSVRTTAAPGTTASDRSVATPVNEPPYTCAGATCNPGARRTNSVPTKADCQGHAERDVRDREDVIPRLAPFRLTSK